MVTYRQNIVQIALIDVFEENDIETTNAPDYEENFSHDYDALSRRVIDACSDLMWQLPLADNATELQYMFYEIGKVHFGPEGADLRLWFKCLYAIFFASDSGPRWGEFVDLYGVDAFLDSLEEKLSCEVPFCWFRIEVK